MFNMLSFQLVWMFEHFYNKILQGGGKFSDGKKTEIKQVVKVQYVCICVCGQVCVCVPFCSISSVGMCHSS